MSVFELIHAYSYNGQGMINRYHYIEAVTGAGNAESLNEAFIDLVLPLIQDIQHEDCQSQYIRSRNLSFVSNDEHTTGLVGVNGTRTGDGMPPHDSMTMQMLVETRQTRMGRKAFGGVPESDFIKGVPIGNTVTRLDLVSDAVSSVLVDAVVVPFWYPCIIRDNGLLPATVNLVNGGRFTQISTQNTRKFYTATTAGGGVVAFNTTKTADVSGYVVPSGNWGLGTPYDPITYPSQPPVLLFDMQKASSPSLTTVT